MRKVKRKQEERCMFKFLGRKQKVDIKEFPLFNNNLAKIFKTLEKNERLISISKEEILKEVKYFDENLRTNCSAAAEANFSLISSICYFRNDLDIELLKFALRPLYYLGIEESDDVVKWVDQFLSKKNSYCCPTPYGIKWLENLITRKEIIKQIIGEFIEETQQDDI
jgi:hypothetical protein